MNKNNKKGSALLVALLIMGILITLTLGLSSLVVREIRQTNDIIGAGQAYYAAEAGIENGLFDLKTHLPGYQTGTSQGDTDVWRDQSPTPSLHYRYRIQNKGDSIPYFPDDEPVFIGPDMTVTKADLEKDAPEKTYNVLPLNGTVTIPLFTDKGDGTSEDVKDFLIQYYVDFDLDKKIDMSEFLSGKLLVENFDILRWKISGNPADSSVIGNAGKTETISDFFPAYSTDSPITPVCIGTAEDMLASYSCIVPVAREVKENSEGQGVDVSENALGSAWSIARQCYGSDAGLITSGGMDITKDGCSIKTFIGSHKRNYLTLMNLVPPDIVGISNIALRKSRANIYYRIVARKGAGEPQLVRDAAKISADGFAAGNTVKRSIDISFKRGTFLPVFNFTLYRPDTKSDIETPNGSGSSGDAEPQL